MDYDNRIPITDEITKSTAITIVAKKRNFSPPRRAKRVIVDAVPPKAPSIPSPERWKIIARINSIDRTSCRIGRN